MSNAHYRAGADANADPVQPDRLDIAIPSDEPGGRRHAMVIAGLVALASVATALVVAAGSARMDSAAGEATTPFLAPRPAGPVVLVQRVPGIGQLLPRPLARRAPEVVRADDTVAVTVASTRDQRLSVVWREERRPDTSTSSGTPGRGVRVHVPAPLPCAILPVKLLCSSAGREVRPKAPARRITPRPLPRDQQLVYQQRCVEWRSVRETANGLERTRHRHCYSVPVRPAVTR